MILQTTSTVLMIRPESFVLNEQTAVNNHFQKSPQDTNNVSIKALEEFDNLVSKLTDNDVRVIVVNDTESPHTPDALFPNNWVSFHHDGRACLYPMYAPNRRAERREEILDLLKDGYGFGLEELLDFTEFEDHDVFLEGTGSMVLDRVNQVCYAALSERTDVDAVHQFCENMDYEAIVFGAYDIVDGIPKEIYHTNVMMSIGTKLAVLCEVAITDQDQRQLVKSKLQDSGRDIIAISREQMNNFAGNILELSTTDGDTVFAMSEAAKSAFSNEQVAAIQAQGQIVSSDISTIERLGGGSVRCMIAEIFLPTSA